MSDSAAVAVLCVSLPAPARVPKLVVTRWPLLRCTAPGINAFLFVSLILCCLLLGGLIKRYKFTYLPESAASMIFGFICGGFLNLSGGTGAHRHAAGGGAARSAAKNLASRPLRSAH